MCVTRSADMISSPDLNTETINDNVELLTSPCIKSRRNPDGELLLDQISGQFEHLWGRAVSAAPTPSDMMFPNGCKRAALTALLITSVSENTTTLQAKLRQCNRVAPIEPLPRDVPAYGKGLKHRAHCCFMLICGGKWSRRWRCEQSRGGTRRIR